MNYSPDCRPEPCRIVLDFDGTLISEHLLIVWVLFLLRCSGWPAKRKMGFMVKSLLRGGAAMMLSRRPVWAPRAVRTAFGTFRGVEEKSLAALVQSRSARRRPAKANTLNLNPAVMTIVEHIVASSRRIPEIHIVSQGSSRDAVRQFIRRSDVRDRFEAIGISTASLLLHANQMETDGDGRYTGVIQGDILTKFNRIDMMPGDTFFIGDDEDEIILKRRGGNSRINFINWRRWKRAKTEVLTKTSILNSILPFL